MRKRSRAQAAQKAPLHALPVAHLGSSGPSCLWQQHYCSSPLSPLQPPWWHHRLQPSRRALVTVPWLCRDAAAVFRVRHEHFNPQQPRTPNCRAVLGDCSSRTAWVTVVFSIHSMQRSQHERAQRSSYPISSVLSEEKEYKKLQNFPAAFSPCPSVIAIGGFLSLLLDASERIVSLGICPGQNHSGFGVGSKGHRGKH